ncbi:hypothetical protein [Blastochloris tepida]|uniref:Uncharacterized protein n=1 Tax=Blastochloris tepida TaxID=2233851 RepID=A0A348G337_9HYPH|nr:hypothetical protein [Blastochloris tepida]BBF93970.1 hypothetical protein BLTE_26550 [Blastochloris tepida]
MTASLFEKGRRSRRLALLGASALGLVLACDVAAARGFGGFHGGGFGGFHGGGFGGFHGEDFGGFHGAPMNIAPHYNAPRVPPDGFDRPPRPYDPGGHAGPPPGPRPGPEPGPGPRPPGPGPYPPGPGPHPPGPGPYPPGPGPHPPGPGPYPPGPPPPPPPPYPGPGFWPAPYYPDYNPGAWAAGAAGLAVGAALAVGTMSATLPGGCETVVVGGTTYEQCGSTWFQPQYQSNRTVYVVVPPPR